MKKLPFIIFFVTLIIAACNSQKSKTPDFLIEDEVTYAADNSFQPIIDEVSTLFLGRHPEAGIHANYVSEDSAIKLLMDDSVRLAITTRPLSEREKYEIKKSHNVNESTIAFDAFALIVNQNNPDTLLYLDDIRGIISGRITDWSQLAITSKKGKISLVFDQNGSSTVRYMQDSLNGGQPLKGNVYAQGSMMGVIETVKEREDIIGVVSTDWLRVAAGDSLTRENFQGLGVNVVLVKRDEDQHYWRRPYQAFVLDGTYPLWRRVYAISTYTRRNSMISLYYYFLKGDAQRVICRSSQLLPLNQVQVRQVVNN